MINYGLTMHGVDRGGGMVKGSVDEGSVVGSQGEGRVVNGGVVGEGSSRVVHGSVDESLGVTEGRGVVGRGVVGSGMVGLGDIGLGLPLVLHVGNESVLCRKKRIIQILALLCTLIVTWRALLTPTRFVSDYETVSS